MRRPTSPSALLPAALLAAGTLLSGCGGGSAAPGPTPTATATVTVTATASPEPGPSEPASPTASSQAGRGDVVPEQDPELPWEPLRRQAAPVDLGDVETAGFTSPSGNIGCLFSSDPYEVRCDRRTSTEQVERPADCQGDYGDVVALRPSRAGELRCVGDTVLGISGETDGSRVLPYGDSVRFGELVCTSGEQGVQCLNAAGRGFLVSRERILR